MDKKKIFQKALDIFLVELKNKYKDELLGVLVAGSFIRGKLGKKSDLDVFIIIKNKGFRIRGSKIINGVKVEYFINPEKQLVQDIEKEKDKNRRVLANVFKDGKIIFDKKGIVNRMKRFSVELLKQGVGFSNSQSFSFRYFVSDLLDDLEDDLERKDFFSYQYNLSLLAQHIIEGFCKIRGIPLVKPKYQIELLIQKDPKIVRLVESIANVRNARSQIKKARALADYVLSLFGGKIPEEYELKSKLDLERQKKS